MDGGEGGGGAAYFVASLSISERKDEETPNQGCGLDSTEVMSPESPNTNLHLRKCSHGPIIIYKKHIH